MITYFPKPIPCKKIEKLQGEIIIEQNESNPEELYIGLKVITNSQKNKAKKIFFSIN
jgi:hypothetical protein